MATMRPSTDDDLDNESITADEEYQVDEQERTGLVTGTPRTTNRSLVLVHVQTKSFPLQVQAVTVPKNPWVKIRRQRNRQRRCRACIATIVAITVVAAAAFTVTEMAKEEPLVGDTSAANHSIYSTVDDAISTNGTGATNKESSSTIEHLQCPQTLSQKSANDKDGNFDEYIEADAIILSNTSLLADYRSMGYDGFDIPFEQAKANIYDYVSEYFVPALQNGASIYESACGTAANLLMTLEILAEHNISSVQVFGSEYVDASVQIARHMLSEYAPYGMNIRQICQGDSTNLSFVPSNSIDVVFTGYIDPLVDPLDLASNATDDGSDLIDLSINRCRSTDEDDIILARKEQAAEEDWFAKWISELVRIAKPGGTVIIEDVAKPLCQLLRDWGGVSQAWWPGAVSKYGWDVDVESIRFEIAPRNPQLYQKRRYNVAMKKKLR